jgi:hypothetical protein
MEGGRRSKRKTLPYSLPPPTAIIFSVSATKTLRRVAESEHIETVHPVVTRMKAWLSNKSRNIWVSRSPMDLCATVVFAITI